MLNIWTGSVEAVRQKLLDLSDTSDRVLVLVPEQFTLQIERDLIAFQKKAGFFRLEVLSPSRLTDRVLASTGQDRRTRIDSIGKQMLLAKILEDHKKSLAYYASSADKQGFIANMADQITSFKQAGLSAETLNAYIQTLPDSASRVKWTDIALIYDAYENALGTQFVDGESVFAATVRQLPLSRIAEDARVLIYGFDSITEQMTGLLEAFVSCARQVHMLLVSDKQADDFKPVEDSIARLTPAEGIRGGIAYKRFEIADAKDERPAEIAYLTRAYMDLNAEPFTGETGHITLYAAPNPYFEAHYIAQRIVEMNMSGIPYGDIAIVMGNPAFAGMLRGVLSSYRIPAYIAQKRPAASEGLARFVLCSLSAAAERWQQADMLGLIKSGCADIENEDVWLLENYILSNGIQGTKFEKPFTRGDSAEIGRLEPVREKLMAPLLRLREAFADDRTASGVFRAVYAYLEETNAYERLQETRKMLEDSGFSAEASQTAQMWRVLMQLISEGYALFENEKLKIKTLSDWLRAGLEACDIGSLPPDAENVMCGNIGNLPLSHPRVVFVCNFQDTLAGSNDVSLLEDEERENAEQKLKIRLALNTAGRDALARLDIYKAMSCAQTDLFITHSLATQAGAALRPYSALKRLRALFPLLTEAGSISQKYTAEHPYAVKPALDNLGIRLRAGEMDAQWQETWRYLASHEKTSERIEALRGAFEPEAMPAPLTPQQSGKLFSDRFTSITRLEKFAECPFKHFMEYGVRPRERGEWTVTPLERGDFYHAALDAFTRGLSKIPGWPDISRKTCDEAANAAARPIMDELLSGAMGEKARLKTEGERYMRTLRRIAWTFTRSAAASDFKTVGSEITFGEDNGLPPIELTLSDGKRLFISGKIDRIDRYEGDDGVYLRVVDYKSGNTALEPEKIYWGMQLQLLLYLKALMNSEKDAKPAATMYMYVKDPLTDADGVKGEIEDALAKDLGLQGIVLNDVKILKKMDSAQPPLALSDVLNEKGAVRVGAMASSMDEMLMLIDHACESARRIAEKIGGGEIAAAPVRMESGNTPCSYCRYADVCRSDISRRPEAMRYIPKMKFREMTEKLQTDPPGDKL